MLRLISSSAVLLVSTLALGALTASAAAQDAATEARARQLREAARELVRAGRFEDAFGPLREAAGLTDDAAVLLELAEVADRLRLDPVALEVYESYLARRPDAPNRAEIEGRVRVLRDLRAGHRFVLDGDRPERSRGGTLVDWNGQPVVVRRPSEVVTLTDWDGNLRTTARTTSRAPELAPFPGEPRSLGRQLARP